MADDTVGSDMGCAHVSLNSRKGAKKGDFTLAGSKMVEKTTVESNKLKS